MQSQDHRIAARKHRRLAAVVLSTVHEVLDETTGVQAVVRMQDDCGIVRVPHQVGGADAWEEVDAQVEVEART